MPPRYAYWTILIDHAPTAFRARLQEDLLPTLKQLQRTNTDVALKWFERGKVWDSPDAARATAHGPVRPHENRGRDWRPGGTHEDPRNRFKKSKTPGDRREPAAGGPPRSDKWEKREAPRDRFNKPPMSRDRREPAAGGPPRSDKWEKRPDPRDRFNKPPISQDRREPAA